MIVKLLEPFRLFDPQECNQIISQAQEKNLKEGLVYSGRKEDTRNNKVAWLEFNQDRFWDLLQTVKGYQVDWLSHPYQISCYHPGEFYDWHADVYTQKRSSQRVLTLTCCLEPAQGSLLEIENKKYDLDKGYAIVFDSKQQHRVTAPKKDKRWSFTIWAMQRNK